MLKMWGILNGCCKFTESMFDSKKDIILNDRAYEDIQIGETVSFDRFVDEEAVERFAELSGDYNPLHVDARYAEHTEFGGPIVHGMLLASFFSTLVGMLCPGKRALYLGQELTFRNPLPVNSNVRITGTVERKSDATKIIWLKTTVITDKGMVVVDGTAQVKVREG